MARPAATSARPPANDTPTSPTRPLGASARLAAIQSVASSITSVDRGVIRNARRSGSGTLRTLAPVAASRRENAARRGSSTPPAWTPGNTMRLRVLPPAGS